MMPPHRVVVRHEAVKRARLEAQRLLGMYQHLDPVRASEIMSNAARMARDRTASFQLTIWRDACNDLRALNQDDDASDAS
jgi:hypothetical protein